ncbi:3391_t:CDS:1, partial [Funneliformis caledonium]
LSTPVKGEKAENVDDIEEDADESASQSLARLYQKQLVRITVAKTNQEEILCWYKYAEGFEK